MSNCAICQEVIDISKSVLTSCNHKFCSKCFFSWLKKKTNCPVCRTVFYEPTSYEIEQEREQLHNLRVTIDEHEELLEEIKANCFDNEINHTLLVNACAELVAEQELKRIEILTLENEIYNLKKSCRSIEKQKQEELKSLEQVLQEQYDILIRRLERSRRRTNT